METKLIGFICLVSVLMLVATNFHDVQGSEMEVQPPDLRTRKSGSNWGRFLGPTGNGKSPETSLLTSWSPTGPPRRLGKRDRDQLRCANRFPRTIVHVRSPRRTRSLNLHEK